MKPIEAKVLVDDSVVDWVSRHRVEFAMELWKSLVTKSVEFLENEREFVEKGDSDGA